MNRARLNTPSIPVMASSATIGAVPPIYKADNSEKYRDERKHASPWLEPDCSGSNKMHRECGGTVCAICSHRNEGGLHWCSECGSAVTVTDCSATTPLLSEKRSSLLDKTSITRMLDIEPQSQSHSFGGKSLSSGIRHWDTSAVYTWRKLSTLKTPSTTEHNVSMSYPKKALI